MDDYSGWFNHDGSGSGNRSAEYGSPIGDDFCTGDGSAYGFGNVDGLGIGDGNGQGNAQGYGSGFSRPLTQELRVRDI